MKKNNLFSGHRISDIAGLLLVAFAMIGFVAVATPAQAIGSAGTTIITTLCNVFNTIRDVIFILAITLFILGGVLYAGANMMPSSQRGNFQGYGMAMIIGAIIGVAIVIAAPFILNLILQSNVNAATVNGQVLANAGVNGQGTGNNQAQVGALCPGIGT